MEILSRAIVITFTEDDAAVLAGQFATAMQLAYGTRGRMPPRQLHAFAGKISDAARGAAGYREDMQASSRYGTGAFHDQPSLPCSDEPVRLTTREAAQLAQVSEGLIRRLCRRRELAASGGAGSRWAIDIASLAAWISSRRREAEREAA